MIPGGWRRAFRAPRPADRQAREDVQAEIAFHLDARTEELIASGLEPEDARARAEREFGNADRARRDLEGPRRRRERRIRWATSLGEFRGDVRYGLRSLRASPRYATVAVLTLALAIGATGAVLGVVNAVLLRPLPVESPERLVMLWTTSSETGTRGRPDYLTAEAWRRGGGSFEDMAILDPVTMTMTGREGAERIRVARISANFFRVLGVSPVRGRDFTAGEARRRERLALVSHDFWRDRLGGVPDAVGGSIELDGRRSRIIGILPAGFHLPDLDAEVWEPYSLFPDWDATGNEGAWYVVGRLRAGATLDRASREMGALAAALAGPAGARDDGVAVIPLSRHVTGPGSRLVLWTLAGAVFLVLLVAAANVAGLSLARSVGRSREFAIRASLGAGPGRIARQLVAESLTLAAIAAGVGAGLACASLPLIRAFGPGNLARLEQASMDPTVLGWTLAVSLVVGALVGLAPAWVTARRSLRVSRLGAGRAASDGPATRRVRRGLVIVELALAVVLLTAAGLLVRSWQALTGVDPGFEPERVLSINLSTSAIPTDAARTAFYAAVLERVESLPGAVTAGMIGDLFTDGVVDAVLTAEGDGTPERVTLRVDEVSEELFATLRTPLRRGRVFTSADGPATPQVAIVNETLARRVWGSRDPLGSRFRIGSRDGPWLMVVGIVSDMRRQGFDIAPIPQVFVPLAQWPSSSEILLVRTATRDPLDLAGNVRSAVREIDPRVPLYSVASVADQIGADLAQRRFQTWLLGGFSLVTLVMAAIGIYGLIHQSVAARAREFAIRMAVGARAGDILGIGLREGLALALAGLGLGLIGAVWAGGAVAGLLFGVGSTDPATLATVSLLLIAVAGMASWIPARRATAVDPLTTLRCD